MASTGRALPREVVARLPDWIEEFSPLSRSYPSDAERMSLAIDLSRWNVDRQTGGPFGAAVFERESGLLMAVGVNSVQRLNNSALHAEVFALMLAQSRVQSFSLRMAESPIYDLYTSCEPCAMCLGAILWSGVRRIVCGASRDDAARIGFDEGPVFPESHAYLRDRGIQIDLDVSRDAARVAFDDYRARNGLVYNG